ncbi:MAG: PHB depolymerase family esterase [Pseudomonadota bacterium]
MRAAWLLGAAALAMSALPAAAACPGDGFCDVDLGAYRLAEPAGDGPHPAVVFLHGWGADAAAGLRMGARMQERGYVVLAPEGLRREGDGPRSWSFHPDFPQVRDERAFIRQIIEDAVAQHDVDPQRILLTGYSIGGSMTSYLACDDPALARAYAPLAGAFWRPHPPLDGCAGPVHLFHTHGWTDRTVPLEGRPLGGGRIEQGDIFYALQVWRNVNGCTGLQPDTAATGEPYWRRSWTACASGSLEFALHPGGHGIPSGWADMVLDWFEGLDTPAVQ